MRLEVYQYCQRSKDYTTSVDVEANYHNMIRFDKMKGMYEVENGEYRIVLVDDNELESDSFIANDYDFI